MSDAPPTPEPVRVKSIDVIGLFGRLNHHIELNLEDRVTILHGPNGVGKTTILRALTEVLSDMPLHLFEAPIQEITITWTDGTTRKSISRRETGFVVGSKPGAPRSFLIGTQRTLLITEGPPITRSLILSGQSKPYFSEDLVSKNVDPAINAKVASFNQKMVAAASTFAQETQALDQSYPQRLLDQKTAALGAEDLKIALGALHQRQEELTRLGLLTQPFQPITTTELDRLDETYRRALTVYLRDGEAKLDVLQPLADRVKILLDNTNQKFRHKRLRVDSSEGLVIETLAGERLQFDQLSSGEQHSLIMTYDLLFETEPNTLVMIDEPELSLHLSWQKLYLAEMLQIARVAQLDVILATHSPFIVGERPDLMVELSDEAAP